MGGCRHDWLLTSSQLGAHCFFCWRSDVHVTHLLAIWAIAFNVSSTAEKRQHWRQPDATLKWLEAHKRRSSRCSSAASEVCLFCTAIEALLGNRTYAIRLATLWQLGRARVQAGTSSARARLLELRQQRKTFFMLGKSGVLLACGHVELERHGKHPFGP